MKCMIGFVLCALYLFCFDVKASEFLINFAPTPATKATLRVKGNSVSFDVVDPKSGTHFGSVDVDTGKEIHVAVDDYAFDNRKGFSIWSVDEGMGIYTIHRVFLYSVSNSTFIEVHPACGDEFINLKVDKKRRRLISAYYKDVLPWRCITRLSKLDPAGR